jgi:CMP-N-acetylneuraminic acid synthetase
MKIVAMVPVKANSQRVPGKNFIPFSSGKSLLRLTLEKISDIPNFDQVLVYSSSPIEIEHTEETRAITILRPKELDSDSTLGNDIISNFIQTIDADAYVVIHVTSPFLSKKSILEGIRLLVTKEFESSMSVIEQKSFLWDEKSKPNYDIINIPRTQDLESFYIETTGFYAFTKESFIRNKSRISKNPGFVLVSSIEAIDIDDLDDFDFAKMIGEKIYE